ncbi:MAG: hypothetical protein GF334_01230 [Candidatus Altiarchaeales archaeon]|nr:hypothetical protein [Candidatus Altiarchaeales archaeon]
MADNGDITHVDIEELLELGSEFPTTSSSTLTESDVDALCDSINREVNLVLRNLGLALPITDADSVAWLKLTKQFGAGSIVLDGLSSQATEEENTRADRWWNRYQERLDQLINSGGDVLETPTETDPRPNTVPVVFGEWDDERRKRFLRFPQRAAADHFTNHQEIRDTGADWKGAIGGF